MKYTLKNLKILKKSINDYLYVYNLVFNLNKYKGYTFEDFKKCWQNEIGIFNVDVGEDYIDFDYGSMRLSLYDSAEGTSLGDSIELYNDSEYQPIGIFDNLKQIKEELKIVEKKMKSEFESPYEVLEKIGEMIREYNNGSDEITADEVLDCIQTIVLENCN